MKESEIKELMFIVISIENNKNRYGSDYETSEQVITRCEDFCYKYNINITHGSAYKELRHKYYYYRDKCINSVINKHRDIYNLRKCGAVTDKEIVDKLLSNKE